MTPANTESGKPLLETAHKPNVDMTERNISLAGGALLAILVLRRPWLLTGALAAVAAAGLIYRGATGYCPVNNAIGRDTSDKDSQSDESDPSARLAKLDLVEA